MNSSSSASCLTWAINVFLISKVGIHRDLERVHLPTAIGMP